MIKSAKYCLLSGFLLFGLLYSSNDLFAYVKSDTDWTYQQNPVEQKLMFCDAGAPPGASDIVKTAASAWNYSRFSFTFAPDTCVGSDDFTIRFGTVSNGTHAAETGTLVPGTVTNQITKCAMVFDSSRSWNASMNDPSPVEDDLYSVALHEFGHCVGLDHSDSPLAPSSVMQSELGVGQKYRTLQADDIAGRNAIYGPP